MKLTKYILLLLALVGIVNALYLTMVVYPESVNNVNYECDLCSFGDPGIWSCSSVARSPESRVFGVFYPFIALAVYPILALLIVTSLFSKQRNYLLATGLMGLGGTAMNLYFLYQEYAYIHKYCSFCLICLASIIGITALSFFVYHRQK